MAQPPPRRFECAVPQCGKVFHRKEHLTRHLKSHNPEPQYQCPVCGRRYARSDVLKRHIEFHPQYANARPNSTARPDALEEPAAGPSLAAADTRAPAPAAHLPPGSQNADPMRLTAALDMDGQGLDAALDAVDRQPSWGTQSQEPWSPGAFGLPSFTMDTPSPSNWTPGTSGSIPGNLAPAAAQDPHPAFLGLGAANPRPPATEAFGSTTAPGLGRAEHGGLLASPNSPAPSGLLASQSGASSTILRPLVNRHSPAMAKLIEVYFAEVHPYWTILHAPTFDINSVSDTLLAAMAMLASWLQNGLEHVELAPSVFNEVMTVHLQSNASLHTLQALFLCVLYCVHCLNVDGMRTRTLQLHGILISACRYLNIFNGQQDAPDGPLDESAFAHWLAEEQLHRLAYAVLRIDGYLCILTDHPTSVRFQEITIPLPKTDNLWKAASEDERRKLQWNEPAGRERAPFCFLMREALEISREPHLPYHLSLEDYHIGLAALQAGAWEASQEAHSFAADGLATKLTPESPVMIWVHHLSVWRLEIEHEARLGKDYWSLAPGNTNYSSAPLTLAFWHASKIKIHAPLRLLQTPSNYLRRFRSNALSTQQPRSKLRTWMSTSCCRTGVWHGAQLGRLIEHEFGASKEPSNRVRMNPLLFPTVLMGAVAALFYAYQVRACSTCTGNPVTKVIDLFAVGEGDPSLATWEESGNGVAVWGPSGIQVCQCSVSALSEWFRKYLALEETALGEFEAFLVDLAKGPPGRG
ncbi:hypothetical protein GQ53DRAFT_740986 [Thozetella sp. PMI_491]|nr:hypothetical protein GQ53DRAFT_740986 [Thozetella sp. PMI_491]